MYVGVKFAQKYKKRCHNNDISPTLALKTEFIDISDVIICDIWFVGVRFSKEFLKRCQNNDREPTRL